MVFITMGIFGKPKQVFDESSIRRTFNEKANRWYFSVVDTIALITDTADARNYWKVTKSRFTKTNPQLVTGCIQLKLPSNDGKSYATDTADSDTLLSIIETISPISVPQFRRFFEKIDYEQAKDIHSFDGASVPVELPVDVYDTPHEITIVCLIAGVPIEHIVVSVNFESITIQGSRTKQHEDSSIHYLQEELYWGIFSRTIPFDDDIIIDDVVAETQHGVLTVRIPKVDTTRVRIIKVTPVRK